MVECWDDLWVGAAFARGFEETGHSEDLRTGRAMIDADVLAHLQADGSACPESINGACVLQKI